MRSEFDQRLAQIALIWQGGIGPAGFRRLVGHLGDAPAVLAASAQDLALPSLRLDAEQIQAIIQLGEHLEEIEQQLTALREQNVAVVCDFEPGYPRILLDVANRPSVLCLAGRILPVDDPAVAIVGTRSPSEDGYQMAHQLAQALVKERITVVSGLALGCDTAAHQGALHAGGRTVAVLGSGITVIRPRENLELGRQIAEQGAVISEQPPTASASVGRLMARNRLLSGLSQAVVIIESGASGGAMRTAEIARRQARLVYAVQWDETTDRRAGNSQLLAGGAQPISGPAQIAELVTALYLHQQHRQREQAGESQQQLFAEE